jgi:hypothetical protein
MTKPVFWKWIALSLTFFILGCSSPVRNSENKILRKETRWILSEVNKIKQRDYEFTFDSLGRKAVELYFHIDSIGMKMTERKLNKDVFIYNNKGKLAEQHSFLYDSLQRECLVHITKYLYIDSVGELIEKKNYSPSGQVMYKSIYKYKDGKLDSEIKLDRRDSVLIKKSFYYDKETGRLTFEIDINKEKGYNLSRHNWYDNKGRISSRQDECEIGGQSIVSNFDEEYDSAGFLVSEKVINGLGEQGWIYKYEYEFY